jgi:DUF4097 and DUF4098 domain-containing protein YvlB
MKSPLLIALLLVAPLAAAEDPKSIDKVNGAIRTEAGVEYADLETVNGSISLATGAVARDVSTVNGGITLDAGAVADSVEAVNGGIGIGEKALVRGRVETVNGGIRVADGAQIAGSVETVNGGIALKGAHVDQDLVTVNGSILVGENSVVGGGITVKKPNRSGWGWGWGSKPKPPRVTIGPNAVVKGALFFEREVELLVDPSAKIGPLKGEAPIRIDAELDVEH